MTVLEAARNELIRQGLDEAAAETVLATAVWWLGQRADALRVEGFHQDAVWYARVAGEMAAG